MHNKWITVTWDITAFLQGLVLWFMGDISTNFEALSDIFVS